MTTKTIKIRYKFVPQGTVAEEPEPDAFYVDVGSVRHPRVFDHHAGRPGEENTPGSMIWEARELLSQQAKDSDQVTIYTHEHPDWNACWGVTLMKRIFEGGEWDEARVNALNTYSKFVLSGFNPSEGPVEKSALAVYKTLMKEIGETGQDPAERDLRKIETGEAFFRFCHESVENYEDLKSGRFLTEDGPYGRAMLTLREDFQIYLRDIQKAHRFTALLKQKAGDSHRADGLKMDKPFSRLFKFWARSDRKHSYSKAGFPLLWVQWRPDRWVISVNPASGYTLEGLGDILTTEECGTNPPDPDLRDREGYDCPNPWYDARNTPNAFTIIDSPRGGTNIPQEKMKKLLMKFFKVKKWAPATEKTSWFKNRFIPYGIPVLSLIALLVVGWFLVQHIRTPAGCDNWGEAGPADISRGRHVAIVIGVNKYGNSDQWSDLSTPKNDAEKVMHVLTQRYRFESPGTGPSILMVTGAEPEPDFENMKKRIKKTAREMKQNDSLLIYFAGHGGGKAEDTFGKWIPADGDSDAKCIENSWLQRVLQKSSARHILIVADCCYAGKLSDGGGTRGRIVWVTPPEPSGNIREIYQKPSRQGITSGNLETVPDGMGHSPFAACLIRAMEKNRDPFMTAGKLFREIYKCSTAEDQAKRPFLFVIPDTCDQQGEFVFRRRH
ncbi:caspase family protein [Desulfobacterales bacterium HSG2]|nr:caspase family protein [Desulfobacterales bacterium HSG2]